MPTPPKISFPITIPNVVATATCQRGMVAGITSGINAHVTKKPSETECFRTTAKRSSQKAPAANVTAMIGKILSPPRIRFCCQVDVSPNASAI